MHIAARQTYHLLHLVRVARWSGKSMRGQMEAVSGLHYIEIENIVLLPTCIHDKIARKWQTEALRRCSLPRQRYNDHLLRMPSCHGSSELLLIDQIYNKLKTKFI